MVKIRDRHDGIVDRLINAFRFGEITSDHSIAEAGSRLRLDIIIHEEIPVLFINVCFPFENNPDTLSDAKNRTLTKDNYLKQYLISKGKNCEVYGFVIGALGSWYLKNEAVLQIIVWFLNV